MFLHRYLQFSNEANLQDMATLLDSVSEMKTTTSTDGNVALTINYDGNTLISIMFYYAVNGIAFPSGLSLFIHGEGERSRGPNKICPRRQRNFGGFARRGCANWITGCENNYSQGSGE